MILAEDLTRLPQSDMLSIECCQYGGHCGFVNNFKLDSWADARLIELINLARYPHKREQKHSVTSP